MGIVVEIFIGIIGSYIVYRQETIEKSLAELKIQVAHLMWIIPKRRRDPPLDKQE